MSRASGANTANITFDKSYKNPPFVSVVYPTSVPNRFIGYCSTSTSTGAVIGLYNTGAAESSSSNVWWCAIGAI